MNQMCAMNAVLCAISVAGHVAGGVVGGAVNDTVSSAWQSVCQSFADAAAAMLRAFAKAFAAIPPVNLKSPGITSVYGISLGVAASVAALLLIGQVIRTALTHDGSALATAFTGIAKAALAFLFTITVGTAALAAADELTVIIVKHSFGSDQALGNRLGALLGNATGGNQIAGGGVSAALLLIFGIIGILLVIVLWFELLLRNAAIAVLIATSPIAAAGQVSETTKVWWSKLASATVQLIILKPVIALVFAVGLGMTGRAQDIETLLSGMLVLVMAVFAWPAIARFFTFASVQVAGGSGLAAVLGFAAGRATAATGAPAGIEPSEFSRQAERRTLARMNAADAASGGFADGGLTAPAANNAAGTAGTAAAAGTGWLAAAAIGGARMAQRTINSLTGRMEQMAGHAGIQGANPYAQPAGTPRYNPGGHRPPAPPGTGQEPPLPDATPPPIGDVTGASADSAVATEPPAAGEPPRTTGHAGIDSPGWQDTGQPAPPVPPVPPPDETRTDPPPGMGEA
jgi:hypothetical protein